MDSLQEKVVNELKVYEETTEKVMLFIVVVAQISC